MLIQAPERWPVEDARPAIFLGGSIEMGTAENWQARVAQALADTDALILNPRRGAWNAQWEQAIGNPEFREQVEWELAAQERADVILMYYAPETRSPITLLELGLFARSGKVLVCCPEGFWRKGNVDIVCARYGVPMFENPEALVAEARKRLSV